MNGYSKRQSGLKGEDGATRGTGRRSSWISKTRNCSIFWTSSVTRCPGLLIHEVAHYFGKDRHSLERIPPTDQSSHSYDPFSTPRTEIFSSPFARLYTFRFLACFSASFHLSLIFLSSISILTTVSVPFSPPLVRFLPLLADCTLTLAHGRIGKARRSLIRKEESVGSSNVVRYWFRLLSRWMSGILRIIL